MQEVQLAELPSLLAQQTLVSARHLDQLTGIEVQRGGRRLRLRRDPELRSSASI